jgi:hypothetical protein
MRYGWNLLIGLDQFANVVLGGNPDETISSRVGRYLKSGSRPWVRFLPRWFLKHATKSVER